MEGIYIFACGSYNIMQANVPYKGGVYMNDTCTVAGTAADKNRIISAITDDINRSAEEISKNLNMLFDARENKVGNESSYPPSISRMPQEVSGAESENKLSEFEIQEKIGAVTGAIGLFTMITGAILAKCDRKPGKMIIGVGAGIMLTALANGIIKEIRVQKEYFDQHE